MLRSEMTNAAQTPDPLLLIIAGQHGDEPLGLVVAQMLRPGARPVLGSDRFIGFHGAVNPEGLGRARRVRNDNVDPNRVWGAEAQAANQADILATLTEAVAAGRKILVLDCHSDHKPAHVLVAGPRGAAAAGGTARTERVEGSLAAWCEDHGIPCLVLEAQEGQGVDATVAAGRAAIAAAFA